MKFVRLLAIAGLALVAACVPQREAPQPTPQPLPRPMPTPPRPEPQPAPRLDWRDIPLTPGGWSYRSDASASSASFGGAPDQARFVVRCALGTGQVALLLPGSVAGGTMTVRTSSNARTLPLIDVAGTGSAGALVPARDSFLDSIVFSRGRFTIEAQGMSMLVIPSWPEPARVVEDCRG